ncbi:MAG: ribosome silencing factor [Nitrosomonas sp.]|nr:ribosome silencing factor [Nitrosomonas sp.]MDP1950307.1 ribosome silencing factor [Nitrosomonas sp.]
MKSNELVEIVVGALEDIKARDITVIEVEEMTALFDCMIIASGDSNRQTNALANHVQEKVKASGRKIYGIEGAQTGEWLLVDLGDVIVHIMLPSVREHYNLEALWAAGRSAKEKQLHDQ